MRTFGIGPCREIGTIKDAIKDAILDGQIPNDRDAAWQMMLRLGSELGLKACFFSSKSVIFFFKQINIRIFAVRNGYV